MTYIPHANRNGILRDVRFSEELRPCIEAYYPDLNPGDRVEAFTNAEKRIGVLLLHFQSLEERDRFAETIDSHVIVELE